MFESPFSESMIKRGIEKGLIRVKVHNLRDFSDNRHGKVDDTPYGGGPGMVIKPEPVYKALSKILGIKANAHR